MASLKMGWYEADITPEKKISLHGQFAERISEYVEKPLTATAMAVECGNDQMVLVSCDLAGTSHWLTLKVRELLKDNKEGLDPEKVMLCAIHTHTGYAAAWGWRTSGTIHPIDTWKNLLVSALRPGQKYVEAAPVSQREDIATPDECLKIASTRIAHAALEAWKNREPASFENAFDRAAIGQCRRADYSDGTAQMWGNTDTAVFTELEGGNDSGVEILFCYGEKKELTGIVVNLACPAQCVQHRMFVSPDFWGETKKLLRERFGEHIFMLPLCSAAGDQCPVDLVRWVNPDTDVNDPNITRCHPPIRKADPSMFDLAGMKKAGRRVANAVFDAWEEKDGKVQENIRFEHHVHLMQLPIRKTTLSEYRDAVRNLQEFVRQQEGDINYNDVAGLQKYLGVIQRYALQEKIEVLDTEVHIIRMGSIAFATNPFELFLDYGNQIKARALCEQTFLVQLCCGGEGYLPTRKAEMHGHYSGFVASGQCGHEGGDLLVRETLKDINSMFRDDYKTYTYS